MRAFWPTAWRINALATACAFAVAIRLHAVRVYGRVIHEYDPWFNYRATEYLHAHGPAAFHAWYDDRSWYPLGRPVGTTVYPGLMYTACFAKAGLDFVGARVSLHDVCVFLPAAFACVTILLVGALTLEASGDADAAVAAAAVMALVPAHTMRSVAGAYDNEAVAVAAIVAALLLWARALREPAAWPWGVAAGVAFAYVAGTWGAYVFVSNLIAVHACALIAFGRYRPSLARAYVAFYGTGLALATRLPVVGMQPLRSAEQAIPLAVLLGMPAVAALEAVVERRGLDVDAARRWRVVAATAACATAALALACLVPLGILSPVSARVRGLFLQHTRTGNPLVDSVAEHRATPVSYFFSFLHASGLLVPAGFVLLLARGTDASLLCALYTAVSAYFARKMVRLVLLAAAPTAVCAGVGGVALGRWALHQVALAWRCGSLSLVPLGTGAGGGGPRRGGDDEVLSPEWWAQQAKDAAAVALRMATSLCEGGPSAALEPLREWQAEQLAARPAPSVGTGMGRRPDRRSGGGSAGRAHSAGAAVADGPLSHGILAAFAPGGDLAPLRPMTGASLVVVGLALSVSFCAHSFRRAARMSEPLVVTRLALPDGRAVIADDYREAYWWLRDFTPEDSRVLAWWDYGYQINGIANRTTLADGNTWNLEHIALVGRCLLLPPAQAHAIIAHLADYVLIWTSRYARPYAGDDVGKAAHIGRIAASVFADMDGGGWRVHPQQGPSPALRDSLLWALHTHRIAGDASASDSELAQWGFEEAFTSRHRMARVFRVLRVSSESKAWVANSYAIMHRCHAARGELDPRCREGHGYPPALAPMLKGVPGFSVAQDHQPQARARWPRAA